MLTDAGGCCSRGLNATVAVAVAIIFLTAGTISTSLPATLTVMASPSNLYTCCESADNLLLGLSQKKFFAASQPTNCWLCLSPQSLCCVSANKLLAMPQPTNSFLRLSHQTAGQASAHNLFAASQPTISLLRLSPYILRSP